ncbi:MAG: S8 family serine peptidase [Opitutaceae bacterium]|nr:S8 family serine peptidase [Opitutaceae bacterium]
MKIRFFSVLVLPILTACGGGGGGGGTRPDAPSPGVPTKPANPYASPTSRNADRLTIPNGREVLVSVADSPVNPDHPELKGRIAGHLPTSTGAAPFASDSTANHGTAVASRIAGNELGFAGNARLLVSSPGVHLFDVNWTNDGHAWALSQGARVLNMSHQTSPSIMAAYGRTLNGAAAAGAVVTVGAGNAREDWSARQIQNGAVNPDSLIGANGRAALPYVLVVGATDPAGVRAETSGFAGVTDRHNRATDDRHIEAT